MYIELTANSSMTQASTRLIYNMHFPARRHIAFLHLGTELSTSALHVGAIVGQQKSQHF